MKKIILFSLVFFLSACSQKVGSIYQNQEDLLHTSGKLQKFHSVVYYPDDIALDFKGYIVGVEKAPREVIAKNQKIKYNLQGKTPGILKKIKLTKKVKKLEFISHIAKYLYNIYETPDRENIANAYDKSFDVLKLLKKDINKEISNYDSVIIFVMGWNTSQEEAIRNFKSLYKNTISASKNSIHPLFIGVTWPSEWESNYIPDFIVKILSFPVKAEDADELGLTWLGSLIHYSLSDIDVPIYVVGHSFGARATTMAVFEGNILYQKEKYPKKYIDTIISLQGAYSVNRFLKDRRDGISHDISNVRQIVLTSSKYDYAMDSAFWSKSYAGDDKSYNNHCKNNTYFMCGVNTKDFQIQFNTRASKVTYLNCDSIIKNNAYLSGGGAHSDIYDKEMGEFLYKVIKASREK